MVTATVQFCGRLEMTKSELSSSYPDPVKHRINHIKFNYSVTMPMNVIHPGAYQYPLQAFISIVKIKDVLKYDLLIIIFAKLLQTAK